MSFIYLGGRDSIDVSVWTCAKEDRLFSLLIRLNGSNEEMLLPAMSQSYFMLIISLCLAG